MKKKIGKVLYNLLLLVVGAGLIIGGFINSNNDSTYLVIIAEFMIGAGFIFLGIKGILKGTILKPQNGK